MMKPISDCISILCSTLISLVTSSALAKTVHYELAIANQKVNITGHDVDFALTVNGGIPAPTLEFTEGDWAEIVVHNKLTEGEVSIHWHGLLVPPIEDGVPYVNTPPIVAGRSRTFRFPIRQNGTYWYHSHTGLQEQKGVYGAFVIHPKKETIRADHEAVVMLSDWSDENPDQIMRNLRKDGNYYLFKKQTLRSIFGAFRAGRLGTYWLNEWTRMGGMDLSDIGYDAFLINGKKDSQLLSAQPGEKVRLRIINAGASTYFNVSLAQFPLQVIASDGQRVEPLLAKELLIGMGETYDVLWTVPERKNFELRATAQDGTGYASTWIGAGSKVSAANKPKPDLYASMNHAGHSHHAEEHHHGDGAVETMTVDHLASLSETTLSTKAPVYELKLALSGDMDRYIWTINGKTAHDDRLINIRQGDVVRFVFENRTMMHHPMHLHGHFFRVLNGNEESSPMKHTVDVPPMGSRTIEFYADEPGQWMLHCHNLYHMDSGMARVVRYDTFKMTPEQEHLDHQDHHLHDPWYQTGNIQLATNIVEGRYSVAQTWNELELKAHARQDDNWDTEGDAFYKRWLGNFVHLVFGGAVVEHDARLEAGVGWILPMLVRTQLLIDNKGFLRADLSKRFQWTSHFYSDAEFTWRQDLSLGNEYALSLTYAPTWHWAGGVKYTGRSFGAGLQYQF